MVFGGYGELTGGLGVLGGSSMCLLYPCMVLFATLEVLYGTRFGSKHYILLHITTMFTRLALPAHFWPIGALLGLPNSHFMSKTSPFRDPNCPNCPNCDAGRLVNALNYGKRRLRQELCPLPVNKRKRRRKVRERKHSSSTTLKGLLL